MKKKYKVPNICMLFVPVYKIDYTENPVCIYFIKQSIFAAHVMRTFQLVRLIVRPVFTLDE